MEEKNVSTNAAEAAEKSAPNGVPTRLKVIFIVMAAVIVGLTAALIAVTAGRSSGSDPAKEALAQSSSASAGSATAPAQGTSTPAQSTTAPAQGTTAHAQGTIAPAQGTSTPAQGATAPAQGATAPAQSTTAPAQGTSAPAGSATTPAGSTTAPAQSAEPSPSEDAESGFTLVYSVDNSWGESGKMNYGVQLGITNNTGSAISGWTLVMELDGLVGCEGWNGTYTASGNTLTVTNAEYNGDIPAGGSAVIGCNLTVKNELSITSAALNKTACTVKAGKPSSTNNTSGGNNGGNNDSSAEVDVSALLARSDKAVQGDDWLHTDGNRILDKDGKQVWLTGVNWFGYNTGTNTFDGLWNSQLKPAVEGIADHGFNLIRVPISAELINSWAAGEYPKANYNNAYNTELNSMNSLEIFDYFLKLAEENGIKVMPDIHSAETNASGHNVNLWYTDKVSAEDFYSALEWMAERYKDNDTIIAYDLKNEPHGKPYEGSGAAVWNDSDSENNWKHTAETAAARILAKNPNVLIMVEGTEIYPRDIKKNKDFHSTDDDDYYFNWWGGNLRGVKDFPVDLGKYSDKLVYSPHDYGPTVYLQPWFEGGYDYDSLMKDCWQDNWLYIHKDDTAPLLIGEWGGFMKEPNLTWMTCMRQLISNYHLNHTFWCYNANSGDTGGLVLDDFTTWDKEKYEFVKEVLWQENGKFVGLDHSIPLGDNGITLTAAKGLQ